MNVDTSYGPPPSLEPELLQLWNKFLNRSDLTIEDDFFERGGDSLLATELLIEVERLTQATVPPSILFETGTVRRFAEWLSSTGKLCSEARRKNRRRRWSFIPFFSWGLRARRSFRQKTCRDARSRAVFTCHSSPRDRRRTGAFLDRGNGG